MFFLSATANILIYFLIPVFFVLFFYTGEKQYMPEISPIVINWEESRNQLKNTETFEFASFFTEEKVECTKHSFSQINNRERFVYPDIFYFSSPDVIEHSLRAPPVF